MGRPDMTGQAFRAACQRRGLVPKGFMGYYALGTTPVEVSVLNAGSTRREQLAYLIREHAKAVEKYPPQK